MQIELSLLLWLVTIACGIVVLYTTVLSKLLWSNKRIFCELSIALLIAAIPFLIISGIDTVSKVILALVNASLIILPIRISFGRLEAPFLKHSTRLNAKLAVLLISVILLCLLAFGKYQSEKFYYVALACTMLLSIAVGISFLWQATWTLKHFRLRGLGDRLTLKELPTVTLAVPARNEDHALEKCLQAAVASDYPKLEVLVLDDCSQDKTPELIRAFAHDGVRFVKGSLPAEGWLGKNRACQTLAEHASGQYIFYIGVDTLLSPSSVSKVVQYVVSKNLSMVAILPKWRSGLKLATLLWQLRYFWQIVLPVTKRRVPVASQSWIIKTDVLRKMGGFASVKNKIVPEGSFARRLFDVDQYRFLVADARLNITTEKRWSSQNETAIRLLYPTFKRQPLYVLAACLALIGLMILPFAVLFAHLIMNSFNLLLWLSLTASLLLLASYYLVVVRTNPKTFLLTGLFLPFSLAQELILLVVSMLAYEFDIVNWKGRNVCYPVIKSKR